MSLQDTRLFISYSRKNKDFIEKLIDRLKNRCTVWWDQYLTPAEVWWTSILDEIERCDCFVLLLTDPYTASASCLAELEYAQQLGKPILPIVPDRSVRFPPSVFHAQAAIISGLEMSHIPEAYGEIIVGASGLKPEQYTKPTVAIKRPDEPTPTGQAQISDVYANAIEVEAAGNYSLAERFYMQVVQANSGSAALRKLAETKLQALEKRRGCLNDYANIVRLADRPATLSAAIELWQVYLVDCGTDHDHREFAKDTRFNLKKEPAPGTRMTDDKAVTMVYVPAGKFLMGSTQQQVNEALQQAITDGWKDARRGDFEREEPQHIVHITHSFWLDAMPVTNAAYAEFIAAEGYKTKIYWTDDGWEWVCGNNITGPTNHPDLTAADQPRVGVTWYEADAYCRWRNCRLPTEAEWEWTARGKESLIYPWGNTFDPERVAWHGKSASSAYKPTGASWVGALDMSGKVWEWVADWYAENYYQINPTTNPNNQTKSLYRVLRGGSWHMDGPAILRASYRNYLQPHYERFNGGFRAMRSLESGQY